MIVVCTGGQLQNNAARACGERTRAPHRRLRWRIRGRSPSGPALHYFSMPWHLRNFIAKEISEIFDQRLSVGFWEDFAMMGWTAPSGIIVPRWPLSQHHLREAVHGEV